MARGKQFYEKSDYARAILEFENAARIPPADAEAFFKLGLAHLAAGDSTFAAACFRKSTTIDPKHLAAQLKLSQLLLGRPNRGAIEDAYKRAEQMATDNPHNPDVLNTLALTELRLGRFEDATKRLEAVLEEFPAETRSSIALANIRLAAGDHAGAEAALHAAVEHAPHSAPPLIALASLYFGAGEFAKAEHEIRRALEFEPEHKIAWTDLGMILFKTGRKDAAGEALQRASRLPGKQLREIYAIFLLESGKREGALAEFERLANQDRQDHEARTHLVTAHMLLGRTASAEKILAAALRENPKDTEALTQRGEILLASGKVAEAQAVLAKVIALRPEAAEAHYILAKVHALRRAPLAQRQELTEALRLNPLLLRVRVELCQLLLSGKAGAAALQLINQTPKSQRTSTAYILQRNWALLTMGDLAEAQKGVAEGLSIERTPEFLLQDAILKTSRKDYAGARLSQEEALRRDPEDLRVVNGILRLYVTQNQIPSALQKLRAYAARRPHSAGVQNLLGNWLLERGDMAGARTAFLASKTADPKFRAADVSLAKVDMAEGKLDSARQILRDLEAAGVRDPEIPLNIGFLETTSGAQAEAIRQFQATLEMDPDNVVALNNLAYLLAGSPKQADQALAYAQKVKELSPENPSVDDTIGWVLYQKGAYAAALMHFETAAKATDDPVIRYHLAMAYVKLGDSKGPQMLASCLRSAPNLPEAKIARELLAGIRPPLKAAR